jgi:hypothetical protein
VGDTTAGRHQVELPGLDQLLRAQAVEVEHLAFEQPGHRLQAHVRVRAYAEGAPCVRDDRAHVVRKAPCADGPAGPVREDAAHGERPDPAGTAGLEFDDG